MESALNNLIQVFLSSACVCWY